MEKTKLDRIGELSRKSRAEGLSKAEADEQFALRSEYLSEMRGQVKDMLDHTYIQYPDGNKEKLKQNNRSKTIS